MQKSWQQRDLYIVHQDKKISLDKTVNGEKAGKIHIEERKFTE